ncbi:fibronectin type III domain-containing protein, partial [Patescibacteria group bacterium]|nr:fibronectin type III domain-containing protein [Patescibacteria group bacterium]
MKRNILIITVIITLLFASNLFTFAQQGDAVLELQSVVTQANYGDEFDVDVVLKNPGQQNVISVRSWLTYDTNALEGVSVSTDDSLFTLSAPGEDNFSSTEGYAKIGRSNISGGVTDAETTVATVRFKVKTQNPVTTVISPHDYQVTELGHTSVNIIEDGFPVNILSEKPDSVTVQLNGGASAATITTTTEPEPIVTIVDIGGNGYANLERPQNLRANTGSGYVDLKWDESDEPELMGYNIYYGKTSGQYSRRRTITNVNSYRIDGLNNGETYYFAITAYDQINRESDYSDEVGIIVNEPLSSTSPWEDVMAALLAAIPEQPQNGPLVGWVVFSAVGLGGTLMFRK